MEHNLHLGDLCPDCYELGLNKRLRYFFINEEHQILKCESDCCMYPYVDDSEDVEGENGETPTGYEAGNQILQPDSLLGATSMSFQTNEDFEPLASSSKLPHKQTTMCTLVSSGAPQSSNLITAPEIIITEPTIDTMTINDSKAELPLITATATTSSDSTSDSLSALSLSQTFVDDSFFENLLQTIEGSDEPQNNFDFTQLSFPDLDETDFTAQAVEQNATEVGMQVAGAASMATSRSNDTGTQITNKSRNVIEILDVKIDSFELKGSNNPKGHFATEISKAGRSSEVKRSNDPKKIFDMNDPKKQLATQRGHARLTQATGGSKKVVGSNDPVAGNSESSKKTPAKALTKSDSLTAIASVEMDCSKMVEVLGVPKASTARIEFSRVAKPKGKRETNEETKTKPKPKNQRKPAVRKAKPAVAPAAENKDKVEKTESPPTTSIASYFETIKQKRNEAASQQLSQVRSRSRKSTTIKKEAPAASQGSIGTATVSASQGLTQSQSHNVFNTASDRLVTRSATMLALFGIALSTFSLKQMLNNPNNRGPVTQLRKLY